MCIYLFIDYIAIWLLLYFPEAPPTCYSLRKEYDSNSSILVLMGSMIFMISVNKPDVNMISELLINSRFGKFPLIRLPFPFLSFFFLSLKVLVYTMDHSGTKVVSKSVLSSISYVMNIIRPIKTKCISIQKQ